VDAKGRPGVAASFSSSDYGEDKGWSMSSPLRYAGLTGIAPILNQARTSHRSPLHFGEPSFEKKTKSVAFSVEPLEFEEVDFEPTTVVSSLPSGVSHLKLNVESVRNLKIVPTIKRTKARRRKSKHKRERKEKSVSVTTVRRSSSVQRRRNRAPPRSSSSSTRKLKIVPLRRLNIVDRGRGPERKRPHGKRKSRRPVSKDIGVKQPTTDSMPSSRSMYAYIFDSDVDSVGNWDMG